MRPGSSTPTVHAGTQLGAYRLLDRIGKGGMGEVWRAEHVLLGRHAAVKLLHASISESEEIVARFFNEARAATAIEDPGIVQIFDFGYHDDGCAYIVMELLSGETLDRRIERLGTMAIDDALRVMRQVASSLGAAHARKIVHRDLKPENIFVIRDPEVAGGERAKILDFGIAKLAADPGLHSTSTAVLLGTPMYMSPEQCRGAGQVDQRSDIYSLGCVLYTMLVGEPPFEATGLGELLAKHMFQQAVPPSQRRADVPAAVDALLATCLAKDPNARYQHATELAEAIDAVMARGSMQALAQANAAAMPRWTRNTMAAEPPRKETTLSLSVGAVIPGTAHRFDRRVIAALAGVTVAAALVGWLALRPGGNDHETKPAAAVAPPPPAPAPAVTPSDSARKQIAGSLIAFRRWAVAHTGAPCPTASDLATLIVGGIVDPWGHPLTVTCTRQPADQMIGVVSAGPDGAVGTPDDLASWDLGPDATAVVLGERWRSSAPVRTRAASAPSHHPAAPAAAPASPAAPLQPPSPPKPRGPSFDGTALDADGIPTSR